MLLYQNKLRSILLITAAIFACSVLGCKKKEHPSEHPEQTQKTTELSADELADAIKTYVIEKADETGGYFVVFDDEAKQELKLTLDKVHRERLARTGDNEYFACADFVTPDGLLYDLDVFMTGEDADSLIFSDFTIHKKDGLERYTWYEEDGIWMKNPVGTAVIETEAEIRQVGEDTSELQESLEDVREDTSELQESLEDVREDIVEDIDEEISEEDIEDYIAEEEIAEEVMDDDDDDDDDNDDDDDDDDDEILIIEEEHPTEHPTEHPI
jgi:hypothetical protein